MSGMPRPVRFPPARHCSCAARASADCLGQDRFDEQGFDDWSQAKSRNGVVRLMAILTAVNQLVAEDLADHVGCNVEVVNYADESICVECVSHSEVLIEVRPSP